MTTTKNTHVLAERIDGALVVVGEFPSYDAALQAFEWQGNPDKFSVRSSADPTLVRRLSYVKLDRTERERLLDIGRRAGSLEGAKDEMLSELLSDPRFSHLEAEELSDYAWAAAKFCFPREWQESWR